jgi:L-asparaginase
MWYDRGVSEHAPGPVVAVIATGGTIGMTAAGDGPRVQPGLRGAQVIAAVPGLAATGITCRVQDVQQAPGASLTTAGLFTVAAAARAAVADGAAGVVVTQGTDTIEETAYFLDIVHTGHAPIAVTGAMRNPTLAGADGPANVLAAIQVAASAAARDLGCVVVMAGEVHEGRWVRKAHTVNPHAFGSPDVGPLGYVVEGRLRLLRGASSRLRVTLPATAPPAGLRVALVTITFDDDGEVLRRIDPGSFAGLVVAAFGAGHVPTATVPVLTDLAARMPVVLASRTGAGPVLADTYGFPGSEHDLLGRGLISAGFLHPLKARVLLYLLLASGADPAGIAEAFATAGAGP